MLPNPEIRSINLQDVIKIVTKRLRLILAICLVASSYTAITVYKQKSMYRASASLIFTNKSPIKLDRFEESQSAGSDPQFIQTQYRVLTSRSLAEKVFDEPGIKNDLYFKNMKDPIGQIQRSISVDAGKSSTIIMVNVESENAELAARIANTVVNVYIKYTFEVRNQATKEGIAWLENQLKGIKSEIEKSEKALSAYVQKNKLITQDDVNTTKNSLENLKTAQQELSSEYVELSRRYKSKHPRIIANRARLEEVNKRINLEKEAYFILNSKMVEYNLLKQDIDSNKNLYSSLLIKAKETDIVEKLETSIVRTLDVAVPPRDPFKPKRTEAIITAIMLSLLGGVGLAFFLEYLDSGLRTAEEVSSFVDLPFLGYIPTYEVTTASDKDRSLVSFTSPKAVILESFRALRTSVLFSSPEDKPLKTILVTSSVPGEGKSFISTNLAIMFVHINERVIIVDVDMRKPKLYKSFSASLNPGLSTFLTGNVSLDSIIKPSIIPRLSLITSGTIPPNATELLTSSKMNALLEELRGKFDRVILDSPPILVAADAQLLASKADGTIMVVKGAKTKLDQVLSAKKKLLESKGKVMGVVINNLAPEKRDSYYYYHYYHYEESVKGAKPLTQK